MQSRSLLLYGESGNPKNPHFFDQAALMSKKEMKESPYYWEDVEKAAKHVITPAKNPSAKQLGAQ